MEPRQITGVYGEVSGLPAPVSAHVREEQLQEPRIYTVTAGERSPSLPMCAQMMMMVIYYHPASHCQLIYVHCMDSS